MKNLSDSVMSQDTPWREIHRLMLPAYGETWLMVGIVMLFVVAIGGAVGVVLFNTSSRGLFPRPALNRALNSVDAAIGYVSQFDAGKVPREKGILFPPAPKTFASQLVIGTPYLQDENIRKLQRAFADPRLQAWLKSTDDPLVKGVLVPVSAE